MTVSNWASCAPPTTRGEAMTADMLDLARRAVACKGWRWMPGMLAVERAVPGMALSSRPARVDDYWHEVGVWLPDLTDPATLGCLLALVREARGEPTYLPTCLDVHDEAWVVNPPIPWRQTRYENYASALVAALEAAP